MQKHLCAAGPINEEVFYNHNKSSVLSVKWIFQTHTHNTIYTIYTLSSLYIYFMLKSMQLLLSLSIEGKPQTPKVECLSGHVNMIKPCEQPSQGHGKKDCSD